MWRRSKRTIDLSGIFFAAEVFLPESKGRYTLSLSHRKVSLPWRKGLHIHARVSELPPTQAVALVHGPASRLAASCSCCINLRP